MGQRNTLCSGQMIDMGMDQQGQGHLHPEPGFLLGNATNIPQPNIHTILQASGNPTTFDAHRLPEHYNSALFYGVMQYNGVQQHHHSPAANIDVGVPRAPNFYNPYMTHSSGAGVVPFPLNHGPSDQLSSSNCNGTIGVPRDEYGRNNHFMDGVRDSCKRKDAEGVPRNFQYVNASASSSSSAAPLNARHFESGVPVMDAVSFPLPQYRGIGTPIMEIESHRSVRDRSGATGLDSVLAHNHNNFIQGNYMAQPFQPVSMPWLDQQLRSCSSDGGNSIWNMAPPIPYFNGCNVSVGSVDCGNMGIQGYHETSSNTSSTNFLHPPPIHHQHHNLHPAPPAQVQGVRGHNINFHPHVAASSYGLPTNNPAHNTVNPSQDAAEGGFRHSRSIPPTGLRIYRPSRRRVIPEATTRNRNYPHLRYLPAEEVAMLEFPGYYEVDNFIDHHRDMRLDIDDMSYEELLALGERIGNVKTGLSEETIISHLKTRNFLSYATCINLEDAACMDRETDFCVICQADYKCQEKIGSLDCGHEYHADCLKKWLLVKNVCPICKSPALNIQRNEV